MATAEAYFDGRGESKDRLVVLSCVVGLSDSGVWEGFRKDWDRRVMPHTGGAPLSVTDCLAEHGRFKGLSEPERMCALEEAQRLLHHWTRNGVDAYSFIVLMDDYRQCEQDDPEPKLLPPEAICVDDSISRIDYCFYDPSVRFRFYFDQNERFLRYVKCYWREKPGNRARGPAYLRRVEVLEKASDSHLGIQLADVYTWTVYTHCMRRWLRIETKPVPDVLSGVIFDPPITRLWDYDTLRYNKCSRHRVLEQETRVPEWVATPVAQNKDRPRKGILERIRRIGTLFSSGRA
jgi:hypothetical protein